MIEKPYIIVLRDSCVEEVIRVVPEDDVEAQFLAKCRERNSRFDEYSNDDITHILETGRETFEGVGNSVEVFWVEEHDA